MNGHDPTQKEDQHDLELLTAGQTVELLSRLLGAALLELEGHELVVTDDELLALNGKQLEHGGAKGVYAVRLVDKEPADGPDSAAALS